MAVDTQAPPVPKLGTIVHYEIAGRDAKKLVAFYGGVFGWKFADSPAMENYFMAETPGDADVAIYDVDSMGGGEPRVTNYISVDNVKTYVEKIAAAGGTVIHEFTVPFMGHGAIALDPEQNMIGVWQADLSARE
jgi:predicted enzyme related to lactoylglutathione lyase